MVERKKLGFRDIAEERAYWEEQIKLDGELLSVANAQLSDMAAREVVYRKALLDYVEWHGAAHEQDCPQDDTCDCAAKPANDAVNAVLKDPSPQAARLVADAERYRKLRNQDIEAGFPRHGVFIGRIPENLVITGEDADKAIDALTGNTKDAGGGNG